MNSLIKLDLKGRLVNPNELREFQDLKEGNNVLLNQYKETNLNYIFQICSNKNVQISISIEFLNLPEYLVKVASRLAELNISLLVTESKSSLCGKKAQWNIISDISKPELGTYKIKKSIECLEKAESLSINMVSHGLVHS